MLPTRSPRLATLACFLAGFLSACGGGDPETPELRTRRLRSKAPCKTTPKRKLSRKLSRKNKRTPRTPDAPDAEARQARGELNFADKDLSPVPKDKALYRIERVFVEPMMLVKGVPTFDQGLALAAEETPLDRYTFNYYRLDDDSLAVATEVTVLRADPKQYIHSGSAVWYDRDLRMIAKGQFDGGKLDGEYVTYDAEGKPLATKLYDEGVPYDPKRFADQTYAPLVGTWWSETQGVDLLYNVYRADGTLAIFRHTALFKEPLPADAPIPENATHCSWKYKQLTDTTGEIDYYVGRKLLGRSRVELQGNDKFQSTITYHQSPSLVGNQYSFQRQ